MTLFHRMEEGLKRYLIPPVKAISIYGVWVGGCFYLCTLSSCAPLQRQDRSACVCSMDKSLQCIIQT